MKQDDVSRMSKKELERSLRFYMEVAAKQGPEHREIQPLTAPDLTTAYNEGIDDGWNQAVHLVYTVMEPMVAAWTNLELLVGMIKGAVVTAHQRNALLAAREYLYALALVLGNKLNIADAHSRSMGAKLGREQFVDFSYAQQLRTAVLDFCDGRDGDGSQLVDLAQSLEWEKMVSSFAEAMRPTRQRRIVASYQFVGEQVQRLVDSGMGIRAAAQKVAADLPSDQGLSAESVRQYHYRWKRESGVVVN